MMNSPRTAKSHKINIKAVGYILSTDFHTTKRMLNNLVKHRPDLIDKCVVKGVMDVAWTRCLWQLNQTLGGKRRQNTVAIFVDKNYIGTHVDFQKYLIARYKFAINLWPLNYQQLSRIEAQNYYNDDELFDKIVPETCKYFKRLCKDKIAGYQNSFIHRIDINNGFIQAGRIFNRTPYLEKENYSVSHDRRGVLSLVNRHKCFNGPEFVISLQPNLWMDNEYVAFGRVVEGEKTLRSVEKLSDAFEILDRPICIRSCDVLPRRNYACLTVIKHKANTFLRSIVHKCVSKATYSSVYGKPEPTQMPNVTDREYVESIIGTIMIGFFRKIGNCATTTTPPPPLSVQTRRSDLTPTSSVRRLRPYSNGADRLNDKGSGSRAIIVENAERSIVGKTATAGKRIACDKSSENGGIRLPAANHKDYWKYKKIYESIAK